MSKKLLCPLIIIIIFSSLIEALAAPTKKKVVKYQTPVETSLVIDGQTGKVLHSRNAKQKIYPASLTKVMTIYLMFEALKTGKLSFDHQLYVSQNATKALPSKLYLVAGEKISVLDSIYALSIKSANDVAVTVAENMAGSEKKFARLMTIKARQLGMKDTNFTNASGWHDPKQYTTAVDLAKLTMAIKRDFPQYYKLFSEKSFVYKGKTINTHNKVAATYPGAEGLKTGYHVPAGCNLITTATRGGKSLVAIVTGHKNSTTRDTKMVRLLDTHFGVPQLSNMVAKSPQPTLKKSSKKSINKTKQQSVAMKNSNKKNKNLAKTKSHKTSKA
ncbi:MAG: D-alanyl-D-alanine carboxypeptidase [Rickettsiaceae bacterium]|nr:D-alanyl-D-alanine carboxypeptidase [Rickettsiaceae bacterium]